LRPGDFFILKRFICFFAAVCLLTGLAYENENLFLSVFNEGTVSFYLTGELPDGYYASGLTNGRTAGEIADGAASEIAAGKIADEVVYGGAGYRAGDSAASAEVFKNGGGYIVICDLRDYETVKKRLSGAAVSGIAIRRTGDADAARDILNRLGADIVLKDELYEYGIICYYGYSKRLKNYINADGKKINIQIAVSGGEITAGYPIILGAY
jgi:hypothetical protein